MLAPMTGKWPPGVAAIGGITTLGEPPHQPTAKHTPFGGRPGPAGGAQLSRPPPSPSPFP